MAILTLHFRKHLVTLCRFTALFTHDIRLLGPLLSVAQKATQLQTSCQYVMKGSAASNKSK